MRRGSESSGVRFIAVTFWSLISLGVVSGRGGDGDRARLGDSPPEQAAPQVVTGRTAGEQGFLRPGARLSPQCQSAPPVPRREVTWLPFLFTAGDGGTENELTSPGTQSWNLSELGFGRGILLETDPSLCKPSFQSWTHL